MGIKSSVKRLDAVEKATGKAKYTEDLIPSNALVGKLLHSTISNGVVKSIDMEDALKVPGVETIITCFDVPQNKYSTAGHPFSVDPAHADIKIRTMLTKRVRYYGDDIALVVADNVLTAQKALEKIKVEYEEYDTVIKPEDGVKSPHALHEEYPGNELARMDFEVKPDGQVEFYTGKFSTDEVIGGHEDLKGTYFHVPIQQHCHIENICCFAYMEGKRIYVVSHSQMPHTLRRNIAEAIGVPIGDVCVTKAFVGGGFGNKQDTYYEPLAAFASMRLGGQCVSIVLSREETFVNSRVRHAMDMWGALEVNDEGRITKKGVRLNVYSGAYGSNAHAIAAYAVTNYFQLYPALEKQVGESATVFTNLPTSAAMRGYGIPQIDFLMESQMDDMAKKKGWDPVEFRKWNIMPKNFLDPFDKFYCGSNGVVECIDKGCEMVGWSEKRKEYDAFNKTSKDIKKGLGMAVFAYKTGVWPIQLETASSRITLNEDGSLIVHVGATELGQGSDTVFAQIAAEITTIPESKIHVVSCQNTDVSPHDAGAYASRQTYVSGSAVKQTAMILKENILKKAAELGGCTAETLDLKDEQVIFKESGEVLFSIEYVALYGQYQNHETIDSEHITAESTFTMRHNAFSFGASFADIEVDVPIGKIKVNKIIAVHDSGTILNPQLAQGQVHGGVAMGLGYALSEQLLFDEKTGKPLNNNLLDYKVPTSMDIPEIETAFVEPYEPTGPFGNKALAEPPTIPQAPAVRNALLHATGVGINELPLNPQRLVHEFIKAGLIKE